MVQGSEYRLDLKNTIIYASFETCLKRHAVTGTVKK